LLDVSPQWRIANSIVTMVTCCNLHGFTLQVEGLLEDVDFRTKVTREKFEELCSDLFDRVPEPVRQALDAAGMTLVSSGSGCQAVVWCVCTHR